MQSKCEFYLADVSELNPKTGVAKVTPNVLHFSLKRPHYSDPEKIDTLYDNIARPEHVENYSSAFETFKQANPKFKLPWADPEVVSVAAEVVEAASESPAVDEIHRVKRSHPKKSIE